MVTHLYGKLLACSQDWRALAVLISSTLVAAHLIATLVVLARTRRRHESLALTLAVLPENPPTHAVWEFLQEAGTRTRVRVLATTEPFAFCAGLLQPTIYVSTGTIKQLTDDELKAVLWHEKKHADDRDPLKIALLAVPRAVFGYLPALRLLITAFLRGREYTADDYALRRSGDERTLLGALAKLGPATSHAVHFSSGHDSFLSARIKRLLPPLYQPPVVARRRWFVAGATTLAILV